MTKYILIALLLAVPVMGRDTQEDSVRIQIVPTKVADGVTIQVVRPVDATAWLLRLEARIDSLEAMLKRAHVVEADSLVPAWTATTGTGLRAEYYRVTTRYKISFEEHK